MLTNDRCLILNTKMTGSGELTTSMAKFTFYINFAIFISETLLSNTCNIFKV